MLRTICLHVCLHIDWSTYCTFKCWTTQTQHSDILTYTVQKSWRSGDNQNVRSSVPVVSRWLWHRNRTLLKVASMVVTWCIVAFLRSDTFSFFLFASCCNGRKVSCDTGNDDWALCDCTASLTWCTKWECIAGISRCLHVFSVFWWCSGNVCCVHTLV